MDWVLFLDDGGVMNDPALRVPQWYRLLGEFFPPILGGTPEAWAAANRVIMPRLWQGYGVAEPMNVDYATYDRAYRTAWLGGMCELVEARTPPGEECIALAHRAAAYVTRRVRSAYPGAIAAIRHLHDRGYRLHTASGECSAELAGYLERMGLRHCFQQLYGPDLVNTLKEGPDYYARIFADAGVSPAEALVVDDSPVALRWAVQVGASTVLVAAAESAEARLRRGRSSAAWPSCPRSSSAWNRVPQKRDVVGDTMQPAFHSLNHRGQVRCLASLARSALRAYSLPEAQLKLLAHSWTTTFRVTALNGDRYVLRIHPRSQRSIEPVRSELLWLAAMGKDGLSVPEPVFNQEQHLVTVATDPGVPGPRLCVLLRWLEGRFFYQGLTPFHLVQAGELMARLHDHAAQWSRPPKFTRHHVDNLDLTQRDQDDPFDPAAAERAVQTVTSGSTTEAGSVVAAAIPRIWATLKVLSEEPDGFGLVHGDLHHGNFLFGKGGIGAIDFDCCGYGHWIYDLVAPLTQLDRHPEYPALREALFTGYRRRRSLPADQETHLETSVALRSVQDLVWLTRQKEQFALVNPSFHDWWEDDVAAALASLRSYMER